jgi:NADP-dependent 3-hydroxy acid dehydrogenase YdfG
MIDINVKACYVSKAIIPQMIEKSGHIINIGSTAQKRSIQTEMYIVPQNMRLMP